LPQCPNCKAEVAQPERTYSVTVEPEEGERGITKRDVGMFRCPRCDASFPRVLGKKRYLLVPETEFTRMKKEMNDLQKKGEAMQESLEQSKKELSEREEALKEQYQKVSLTGLESELSQLEKHVKYLRSERDRLSREISRG